MATGGRWGRMAIFEQMNSMSRLRILPLMILLLLTAVACQKQENYNPGDFYSCHHQSFWTDQQCYDQLLGKWQLIYAESGEVQQATENIILIFTDDNILRVFRDGQEILVTYFHVQFWDSENYTISTNDYSPYTQGRLLFCGSEMECSDNTTGRNNYFRKAP
jgi:hypothetical protein